MAYVANPNGKAIYKAGTKYPKRLSKRESRVLQTTIDTVVDEGIGGGSPTSINVTTDLTLAGGNIYILAASGLGKALTFPTPVVGLKDQTIQIINADNADWTIVNPADFFSFGFQGLDHSRDTADAGEGEFFVSYTCLEVDPVNDAGGYKWTLLNGGYTRPAPPCSN